MPEMNKKQIQLKKKAKEVCHHSTPKLTPLPAFTPPAWLCCVCLNHRSQFAGALHAPALHVRLVRYSSCSLLKLAVFC